MKRIRHLDQCDYIVPIGQRIGQVLTLSNQSNVMLERTWHQGSLLQKEVMLHAKFNSSAMEGIQFFAELRRGDNVLQSNLDHFVLSSVNTANWSETFVANIIPNSVNGVHTGVIDQATLLTNELSGKQVYAISVELSRKRLKFRKKIYVNHLGCFDSIVRLRHSVEHLEIEKVDE